MLDSYYKKLSDEKKQIAIIRLSKRIGASKEITSQALENMNPLITIDETGKVIIFQNSFKRLRKRIEQLDPK